MANPQSFKNGGISGTNLDEMITKNGLPDYTALQEQIILKAHYLGKPVPPEVFTEYFPPAAEIQPDTSKYYDAAGNILLEKVLVTLHGIPENPENLKRIIERQKERISQALEEKGGWISKYEKWREKSPSDMTLLPEYRHSISLLKGRIKVLEEALVNIEETNPPEMAEDSLYSPRM